MARKIVDIGVAGNDGTGDSIREAFRKTNENFSELYAVFGQGGFLKFTDLSDTPNSLVGESGKIPVVNTLGNAIVLKDIISPLGTISVTQDGNSLKLDTLSSRIIDDPLPKLAYSLDARNQLIGGLRCPVDDTEFETARNIFNTDHNTNYSADTFAINKGYADAKYVNVNGDTMYGHLNVPANASGTQAPRASEVVLKTGADMTGTLTLNDHPGGLAGAGTPNGPDDLQAVTKYYVDNAAYSSRVNLFVSTSGDDTQARTPPGKEGRERSYAFASINKACQKAEELVNSAPWETGPYRQLIAYNDGEAYSEVTRTEPGVSGTTRVYFSNYGGNRVDQGRLPKPDIVSGKIVVGRNSGAKGFIYQYYGADGSSGIGEDYFDLQDVEGVFEVGENLEFDQAVRDIQITIFVESGSYYEDYPIRIPANTAIVGDELRRCLIRPADRPSKSPWVDVWFRRDLTFDGLDLTSTEYGYHYLTDPSDPLSEPKNNRDIDVFLCNDAVIIRQITCQGHGGFMMVLDPEGQILTKSAYIQQSGSFAGSVNKQAFRGGQYVDGFAGNVSMDIVQKINDLEFLVTGAERAPTTPCSFVVDGQTFKVDAYTDDGTGYGGARQLIRRNLEFIKAEVIGYIDSQLSPEFVFNSSVCSRDVGLIVDALGWDLAIGTNFNSVRAGQAYFRGTQYDILPDQISQTNDALTYTKSLISEILAGNSIAQGRAEDGVDEILDIINNGLESADTLVFPTLPGTSTSTSNSKDLLLANLEFIKEEGIAYIADSYPTFVYDEDKCRRDTTYIVEAVIYDLLYGGNSATIEAGLQYYDGSDNIQIAGQTLQTTDALNYISTVAQSVVQSIAITYPKQTDVLQVLDLSNPGSAAEAAEIAGFMSDINTIILGGPNANPGKTYPPLAGVDSSIIDSKALLIANKESLQSNTVTYLDQRYSYNKTTCARDTGYIADAIAHDIYYGGNLKTIQAGLAYFNASASSKIVIDTQLQNTLAAIAHIEYVIQAVINNVSPAQRYQSTYIQYIDTDYTEPAASVTITSLFSVLTSILNNPPTARDAKSLLAANKEFIKAEVIAYLNNKYVSFSYDQAKCERDVGYVVDALGYDLMFGSDFQSIIAGRAYWRGTASVAVGAQQAATIDAYVKLKELALAVVSGNATATASVTTNMDTIIDIVTNGYGTSIWDNFTYNSATCQRDIRYLVDSIRFDAIFNTNYRTVSSARRYLSASANTFNSNQKAQTAASFAISKALTIAELSDATIISRAEALWDEVIDIVTNGTFAVDGFLYVLPGGGTNNASDVGYERARDQLIINKTFIRSEIIAWIADQVATNTPPFSLGFTYDSVACSRDVGYIIDALVYDLTFGGNLQTYDAAKAYFDASVAQYGSGEKDEVLAAMAHLQDVVGYVIDSDTSWTKSTSLNQDTSTQAGSVDSINTAQALVQEIYDTVSTDGVFPTRVEPDVTWTTAIYQNEFAALDSIAQNSIATGTTDWINSQIQSAGAGSYTMPLPTSGTNNAANSGYLNARNMIEANREFVKAEVIQYITNNYVGLSYDPNKCRRDIDYILDSTYYDLTYGGNVATGISARAYYEGIYYRASSVGPTAKIIAISSNILTTEANHGLDADDTFIPTTTENGLTAGQTYYVINTPSSNSLQLSATQGGASVSLVDGLDLSIIAYIANEEERTATIAAYGYMQTLLGDIALDSTITPLQVTVPQVRSGGGLLPGSTAASNDAEAQIQYIIDVVTSGTGAAPATVTPSTAWVNATLVAANNSLQSAKASLESDVTTFINTNYGSGFTYDVATCSRDVGYIVGNVSSDLLYGGTYLSIRAANRYHIGTARTRIVLGEQLAETIDGIEYAKYVAQQVLAQQEPTINFQIANGVENPIAQVFDDDLDGSSQVARLGELMDIITAIVQDPDVDVTTVVADAEPITYPTYRLILSDTTPITNPLEFLSTGFVSSVDSGVGDGSYDVTFTIPSVTPNPLTKTRYRMYGNSTASFNNDSLECVASTSTTMTLRYADGDPTSGGATPYGTGTTYIEYVKQFMLLSAGNTSMCSNDFTQINDVGYGLVATNLGLIETVSVFSYYCWVAYYANNGGQIRSLNGSNAHGEYGIMSEGSDPLEVPDKANLADNMVQVMKVFKTGDFVTYNVADELAIYVYDYDYAPYNVAEAEINHGSGVITDLAAAFAGGSGYANGTYIDVPLQGGTGSGATANIVVSGGVIVTVGLVQGGIRYTEGDILSVNDADVGGGGGSSFTIAVDNVIGNGIARYEIASCTDVSPLIPETITGTPGVTGPNGNGKFEVTYSFAAVDYGTPLINVPYTVAGNSNSNYNGTFNAIASTSTSVTLEYDSDPGAWGTGASLIWGRGNVIRLNINTGGNNDTATNGLATDLDHDQPIIVRLNQNFKFYEVDDTNPTRPSTALTFVGDPNPTEAIVYRVLAYGQKGPLNEDLAAGEAVLGFDTTYDYVKLLVSSDATTLVDPNDGAKTMGSTAGDLKIAIDRVNEPSIENRLNSGEMIIAWDGKIHRVLSYTDMGIVLDYAYVEIEDVVDKCLPGRTATPGLYTPVDPDFNLDIAEPPTLRVGLTSVEPVEIIVRISTCRVTGHDFLDIGSGSYNQTNFPSKIYGAPREPNQANEVTERTRGRCFYVTTDQDGIFRVGRFFTVDQGTGRVTFAASIALSNLDGLGFKRGVTVSEFSNDDTFTDGANDALPTEAAVQGYLDRRLGMDRTSLVLPESSLIGPGYMDRAGIMAFSGPDPMNLGGYRIANLGDPVVATDAATKDYVDVQDLSNVRVDTYSSPARTVNDMLVYNGTKWVNAESITSGDIQVNLAIGTKSVALDIKNDVILNVNVHAPIDDTEFGTTAIVQSKLYMNKSGTLASAPTGTEQSKQSNLGIAAFNSAEFQSTDGWIELLDSTSAATGVTFNKIQYMGNGTLLGNRSGAARAPYEITPAQVVSDGDGIKNAWFNPVSVGTNGRAMILTAITPNTYSTINISTSGETSSLVKTDSSGVADVQQLKIDGYKTLDTSGTTLEQYTPGNINFLSATGTTSANTTISLAGTTNATALTTSSTTTFSPANANVTLSPTGTGTVIINPASVGTINNVNIGGSTRGTGAFTTLTANNTVTLTANTSATSTTSGTLVVTGGVGISQNLHVGGTIYGGTSGALSLGSYLSYSSGTTFNGSASKTLNTNATSSNVGSTLVARDSNGDFNGRYINSSYFNSTDNVSTGTLTYLMGKFGDNYHRSASASKVATFLGGQNLSIENLTITNQITLDNTSSIRQNTTTWTGDAANNTGKLEYHSNRWYINAGGNSTELVRFRRGGTDVSWIDNSGVYNGTATAARYADLAEKYLADADYEVGTVVVFGGENEITVTTTKGDHRVAGIISGNPAYMMNTDLEEGLYVGLTGRLPCKVVGKVQKGDILVTAAKAGYAIVNNDPKPGTIVGKALENKDDLGESVIEVVVGRF